jgi:hypothetical protein
LPVSFWIADGRLVHIHGYETALALSGSACDRRLRKQSVREFTFLRWGFAEAAGSNRPDAGSPGT